jgi:hypothetical protein
LSFVIASADKVSKVIKTANFFFVPASRKEWARTAAPACCCQICIELGQNFQWHYTWEICIVHDELRFMLGTKSIGIILGIRNNYRAINIFTLSRHDALSCRWAIEGEEKGP